MSRQNLGRRKKNIDGFLPALTQVKPLDTKSIRVPGNRMLENEDLF